MAQVKQSSEYHPPFSFSLSSTLYLSTLNALLSALYTLHSTLYSALVCTSLLFSSPRNAAQLYSALLLLLTIPTTTSSLLFSAPTPALLLFFRLILLLFLFFFLFFLFLFVSSSSSKCSRGFITRGLVPIGHDHRDNE